MGLRWTHATPQKKAPLLPQWLVEHSSVVRALPAVGNGAYAALACGFLMTDIFALRVLLVGGYSGLVTYHALQPRPLRIPLRWSMFFVAINAAAVAQLAMDRLPIALSDEEEVLHVASFAPLSQKQFKRLLDIGRRVTFADGTGPHRGGRRATGAALPHPRIGEYDRQGQAHVTPQCGRLR